MRKFMLPLVAALALGCVVLAPTTSEARPLRYRAYYPSYGYNYAPYRSYYYGSPYYYSYPSYGYTYGVPPYYSGGYYGGYPYVYGYRYGYASPGFSFYIR